MIRCAEIINCTKQCVAAGEKRKHKIFNQNHMDCAHSFVRRAYANALNE